MISTSHGSSGQARGLLLWQIEMGADEAVADLPRNYFAMAKEVPVEMPLPPQPIAAAVRLQSSPSLGAATARELADKATTLAELEAAVRTFDGCSLKKTAAKTVFADGNPNATLMIIGEAPGADEDRQGIPFCGASGKLLDKMLATIGFTRAENLYIMNSVYWRPPGNRQPSMEETAICLPFIEKHIALVAPKLLLLAGGVASTAILRREESMSRLRGRTYDYTNPYLLSPIPLMATYHPSYLLGQPAQKRLAWQDMLAIQSLIKHL